MFNLSTKLYFEKYYSVLYNSRSSYFEQFFETIDILSFFKTGIQKTSINTTTCIQPFNVPFTTSPKELIHLLGNPEFKKSKGNESEYHAITFFYRKRFFSKKAIVQFHYIDNIFSYCIITFSKSDDSTEKKIIDILKNKYTNKDKFYNPCTDAFVDENGNYVFYEKSIYTNLIYINNSKTIKDNIYNIEQQKKVLHLKNYEKYYEEWRKLI